MVNTVSSIKRRHAKRKRTNPVAKELANTKFHQRIVPTTNKTIKNKLKKKWLKLLEDIKDDSMGE